MYWNARIKRLGYQFRQKMSFSRGIFHSRQKRRKGKGTELRLIFDNSKHKRRFLCPQRGNTGEGEVTVQVRKLFIFRHPGFIIIVLTSKDYTLSTVLVYGIRDFSLNSQFFLKEAKEIDVLKRWWQITHSTWFVVNTEQIVSNLLWNAITQGAARNLYETGSKLETFCHITEQS